MADAAARPFRLRGDGRVTLPAPGLADAEHRVLKELAAAWPEARAEVLELARPPGASRIVEEFTVVYRILAELAAPDRAAAFRAARARLAGTRYEGVEWGERIG